jgi:predicted permease
VGGYDLADCYAYRHSITDLPMLTAVGHPTAVNPDRALRKAALERGWPVLQFSRPVSMRSRFAVPSTPVVTGAAMGVGAAVVGLAWLARHRALREAAVAAASAATGTTGVWGRRRRRGA